MGRFFLFLRRSSPAASGLRRGFMGQSVLTGCLSLSFLLICNPTIAASPRAASAPTTISKAAPAAVSESQPGTVGSAAVGTGNVGDANGNNSSAAAETLSCVFVIDRDLPSPPDACPPFQTGTRIGSGDVGLIVSKSAWDKAVASASASGKSVQLFINGIAAGDATGLVGAEAIPNGLVRVRFHVGADRTSRTLWTAIFRSADMTESMPLRASVGWDTKTSVLAAPVPVGQWPRIQITSDARRGYAFASMIAVLLFLAYCMVRTDAFRDGPSVGGKRATYSLARLQVGIWILFILGAGLFIWLVLGALPTVEPTLVGLLGVSAATTAASVAVDSAATNRAFVASRGLLLDIITGWDGGQQLHRIQALLVNALLLAVGFNAVIENLAYPVFDASWLALLGVSGATQTVLKQALEGGGSTASGSAAGLETSPKSTQSTSGAAAIDPLNKLPATSPLSSGRSI
jgi:hypothetical protein